MRRFALAPALLVVLALPSAAWAAPPRAAAWAAPPRDSASLDGGPYVQVSPGAATWLIDERRSGAAARVAWPWSLGAGRMFTRGDVFKLTVGGSLEHRIWFLDAVNVHGVHALAESRIGAGNHYIWGYGLAGVGAATTILDAGFVDGSSKRQVDAVGGVVLQVGAGIQVLLGRRLFFGGEVDVDLGYYFPNVRRTELQQFSYHTLTLEVMLGGYF